MTSDQGGHFADKHPADRRPDAAAAREVERRAVQGEMPCAVAFKIAEDLGTTPAQIGLAMDSLEIRMVKCQMGLFGYKPQKRIVKPAPEVQAPVEEAIRKALIKGRLPCAAAWAGPWHFDAFGAGFAAPELSVLSSQGPPRVAREDERVALFESATEIVHSQAGKVGDELGILLPSPGLFC